jgi:undecaprenyl diphosphate synthase
LLIRTGGESRISNFMLWQMAYTELFFTDVLWPSFTPAVLDQAIVWYGARDRRFGGASTLAVAKV